MKKMYSIWSFSLTFPSVTLACQLFSIAPLLTSPLLLWGASWLSYWSPTNFTNCPSFSVLSPQQRSLSYNFQPARCNDFAFYFHYHYYSAQKYSSLFFGTKCGQIFHSFRLRQTPTWSLLVFLGGRSERREAFAAAHNVVKIVRQ